MNETETQTDSTIRFVSQDSGHKSGISEFCLDESGFFPTKVTLLQLSIMLWVHIIQVRNINPNTFVLVTIAYKTA